MLLVVVDCINRPSALALPRNWADLDQCEARRLGACCTRCV